VCLMRSLMVRYLKVCAFYIHVTIPSVLIQTISGLAHEKRIQRTCLTKIGTITSVAEA
jgi:hypothetical protein